MKYSLPVINLDNKWYIYQGAHLKEIEKPEELSSTNLILTDFNDAIFGLETVSGPVEHAAALIEKRLRDIGLLDGPSKVIVHNSRKIGDTVVVVFTAIPAESYSEYFELVDKQNDHCLIVPLMSVLEKQVDRDSEKSSAVIFHHDREFDLIVVHDNKIRKVSRLTAFSTSEEDINSTLDTLSKEINAYNLDTNSPISTIKWLNFLAPKGEAQKYSSKIHELTSVDVVEGPHSDILLHGEEYKTSIPFLINDINAEDAANDSTSKILYKSERMLPLVAALLLVILLALTYNMWKWNAQISDIEQELSQSNRAKIDNDIASIKSDLAQSNRKFASNKNAQETSQWLYNLNGIQSSPDPKQLVDDIGSALPQEVQIVGISLDARRSPATVVLDGMIDKPLKLALKDLENMSTSLLNKGYKMESNSSIELSDNNDFRMTLKVDYNDK
jgi:hypothetical protein